MSSHPARATWRRRSPSVWALALLVAAGLPAALATSASPSASAATGYQLYNGLPAGAKSIDIGGLTPRSVFGGHTAHGIPSLDTLPNFSGHFNTKGFNATGQVQNTWETNFIGNDPTHGGTTTIGAPVIPVSVQLLDVNGNPIEYSDATQYESAMLNSPEFSDTTWSTSSTPTELPDAINRADWWSTEKPNWHTELAGQAESGLVISVPFGDYQFQLNGDGSCCEFILVDYNTFNNLFFNAIVSAINAGTITTKDLSTFVFPNTYLYFGNQCCVLGYHTYVLNDLPNGVEQRWVVDYSSWITPGLFQGGLQDVTALSHEIAESFADPFVVSDGVHGLTPWWLSPNGNCQDNMEVGDVIENLPNGVDSVTMNGFTYHPQNIALKQWFDPGTPSDAFHGAYSYPDTSVLTSAAPSQNVNCS